MFYDRKIKYLDYYENGERIKGGGFVKLEVRDGSLRIDVTVTGLHPTDSFERDILLRGKKEEKAVGKIVISQGRGHYLQECRDLDDLGGIGLNYGELQGIRIPVGTGREITGSWQVQQVTARENSFRNHDEMRIAQQDTEDGRKEKNGWKSPNEERKAGNSMQVSLDDGWKPEGGMQNSIDDRWKSEGSVQNSSDNGWESANFPNDKMRIEDGEQTIQEDGWRGGTNGQNSPNDRKEVRFSAQKSPEDEKEPQSNNQDALKSAQEISGSVVQTEEPGNREEGRKPRNVSGGRTAGRGERNGNTTAKQPVKLMEDKWSQLWAIYPHVRPFRDGREYLSIGPADFVLFSADAYKMVNNSFLLHGYYNYNHLILTRIEKKGEILYYIGAPGNYFEREKQVAIMFGFESFECAEEPAQTGDFGYYMMRTQL